MLTLPPSPPLDTENDNGDYRKKVISFPLLPVASINQAQVLKDHYQQLQIQDRRRRWRIEQIHDLARELDEVDKGRLIASIQSQLHPDVMVTHLHTMKQLESEYDSKVPIREVPKVEKDTELRQLVTWGVESKLMPVFKLLQNAHKYVSTTDWLYARTEMLLNKAFEKYREHCELMIEITCNGGGVGDKSDDAAVMKELKPRVWWDSVLDQIDSSHKSIQNEAKWKRRIAKQLAMEAAAHVIHNVQSISNTEERRFFYDRDFLPHILEQLSLTPPLSQKFTHERAVDPTNLATIADAVTFPSEESNNSETTDNVSTVVKAPSLSIMGKSWREGEDHLLTTLAKIYKGRFDLVSEHLSSVYSTHQRSAASCHERLRFLAQNPGRNYRDNAELAKDCERHFHRLSRLMIGSRSKLVPIVRFTPLSMLNLKSTTPTTTTKRHGGHALAATHPSHEAAVKKATQSITRLRTPAELALRRLQRMRQFVDNIRVSNSQIVNSNRSTPVKSIPTITTTSSTNPSSSATVGTVGASTSDLSVTTIQDGNNQ